MKPTLRSSHPSRPFSPALIGLSGIVVGMCLITLSFVFVRDTWPEMMPSRLSAASLSATSSPTSVFVTTSSVGMMANPMGTMAASASASSVSPQQAFQSSGLRIISVLNGLDDRYTYFVATDRAAIIQNGDMLQKDNNDTACGSIYTQPNCYLLRENRYVYGADPTPKLIATWNGPGSFNEATKVKMTGTGQEQSLEFTVVDGDAGCSVEAKHKINLATGQDSVTTTNKCDQ